MHITLLHHPICSASRAIRLVLNEKKIPYEPITERYWEPTSRAFHGFFNETPIVTLAPKKQPIEGLYAIIQAIESLFPQSQSLFSSNEESRARQYMMLEWYGRKCYHEAIRPMVRERFIRFYHNEGSPSLDILLPVKHNVTYHLQHTETLLAQSSYIAGDTLSMADFVAAGQFSLLDYTSDINWPSFPRTKDWYSIIKSRPSFRPLLMDVIPGFKPSSHYMLLDF